MGRKLGLLHLEEKTHTSTSRVSVKRELRRILGSQ